MIAFRDVLTTFAVTSVFFLSACSDHADSGADQPTTAGTAAAAPADRLSADQVSVTLTLQGAPTVSVDGKFIDVRVILANHGKTMLTSTGPNPVNMGAHSVDANGTVIDNDLARAGIPNIARDTQATVTIQLPIDKVLGKRAQILPVQENVAWFDSWGTKALTVGPFNRCTSSVTDKVCGADGKPLAGTTR